jgi:ornithine carbamoyltransferase
MSRNSEGLLTPQSLEDNLASLKGTSFTNENHYSPNQLLAICQKTLDHGNIDRNERYLLKPLKGKVGVFDFDKFSTRTLLSCDSSFQLMGGVTEIIDKNLSQSKNGESVKDSISVYGRFADLYFARISSQSQLESCKEWFVDRNGKRLPVISGMTNERHPLQVLATATELLRNFGRIKGLNVLYTGDWNNVARSFFCGLSALGANVRIASPNFTEIDRETLRSVMGYNGLHNSVSAVGRDPRDFINGVNLVYTDVYTSMGQDNKDMEQFRLNRVDESLIELADRNCIVSHCMPIKKDELEESVKDRFYQNILNEAEYRKLTLEVLFPAILRN